MSPDDLSRRRNAKLFNERLKLMAAFCNTVGVATFVALVVAPFANDRTLTAKQIALAAVVTFMLHGAGQALLLLWRSED